MSKRFRDEAYSPSALEKKNAISLSIYSLSASQSNATLFNNPTAIPARKLSRREDFVHRIRRMLSRSRGSIYEVQCSKNEVQEKGSNLELENRFEILSKRVEKLEGQIKCEHRLGSNILERTSVPFPGTKLVGENYEDNAAEIMGWIKNPDASTIGVWGMPGVGKTALLEHICNQLIQDVSFSADVYWLTVSECDTVYKWQAGIATCFGFDFSNVKDGAKRKRILCMEFAKRGDIVLILDDMWHPFSRDEVGIPAGVNGCKIILTTCSLEVCRKMKCGDLTVKVRPLPYGELDYCEQSFSLFAAELKDYDKLPEEVEEVATKVVDKCHGLPLAIITMGFRMSGEVDINEWTSVLDELDVCEQIDMKYKVFSKLQKIFDSSNDEMLLECFLSSVYYMNEEEVSRSELIAYWIEEGLLDEMGSREKQLRKGNTIMNKLLDLSLLDYDGEVVVLQGLMEDMAIHITKENQCPMMLKSPERTWKVPKKELWSEDLVRVSHGIQKIPDDMSPYCPKLTVLNLKGNPLIEVPEPFFMHMKDLTVLNLSYTIIERLPNSVCNLENLRALKLVNCKKLVYVPSLENLMKLKVLHLFGTSNVEGHLGIENLKLLEELSFTWKSDWSHFNSLMESWPFSSLLNYNFLFHNLEIDYPGWKYEHNRKLHMVGVDFRGNKILLPRDIQRLSIDECKGMEYMFSATKQVPFSSPHCHTLEDLSIRHLQDLRGIVDIEVPQVIMFPALRKLTIFGCPKLRNLLSVMSVQQSLRCFSNLEKLSLIYCEELQDLIIQSMNEDVGNLLLPNLRVLDLDTLPKMSSTLCMGPLYAHLKKIYISSCARIKEVLVLDLVQQSQPLPNLEVLKVLGCENLEVIFSSSNSNPNPILALPKLKTLQLQGLPKLGCIYRGLLLCTRIDVDIDICCPKVLGLSNALICDKSSSTLAELPDYDANKDWWEPLKDFPEDARRLSDLADKCRRLEQCQGPSSSTPNAHQIPSQPEPGLGIQDQASHSLDLEMGLAIAQSFSYAPQPLIEQDLLNYGLQSSHAVGPQVQNYVSLMPSDPNVMHFTQGSYGNQWLPNYHGNNEASSSGHGYGWSGDHQQFHR